MFVAKDHRFIKRRYMKAIVVLAHPYKESFNHAIYNRVIETLEACGVTISIVMDSTRKL